MSLEKALSSGANSVNPPEPEEATSCELSWLRSWVVFKRRIRTENLLAFLRIWMMSMVGPFGMVVVGVGAPLGVTGTSGTVLSPGDGAAAAGEGGEGVGWGKGGDGGDGEEVGG